jgi:hypothetical protein
MSRLWMVWQILCYGSIHLKCLDYRSDYDQHGVTVWGRFEQRGEFLLIARLTTEKPQ